MLVSSPAGRGLGRLCQATLLFAILFTQVLPCRLPARPESGESVPNEGMCVFMETHAALPSHQHGQAHPRCHLHVD